MDIRYRALSTDGSIIFCNLSNSDKSTLDVINCSSQKFGNTRAGKLDVKGGTVYGYTSDKGLVRSSSKFKSSLTVIADTLGHLNKVIQHEVDKVNKSTSRLLHNLTSLNAHNIQEIYSLIPQEHLAKKTSGQIKLVEGIIQREKRDTALCLLRVAKNNTAMKTEFSVFNKLFEMNPKLQRKFHNVHKVLMNILYLFFSDFTDKNVMVDVDCDGKKTAFFDYESIHVALFHVIENAVKYVKPNTTLNISISDDGDNTLICFEMISLQITANEIETLFDEGISGEYANKFGKSGSGIGMSRASNILQLNSSSIRVELNETSLHGYMGTPYQENKFIICLNRDIEIDQV